MYRYFYLVVILCLCGCAMTNGGIYAENLVESKRNDHILLTKDTTFELNSKFGGMIWTHGLHQGIYKPILENDKGIFYKGNGRCVIRNLGNDKLGDFLGGVWIPKVTGMIPTIYYYFEYNPSQKYSPYALATSVAVLAAEGKIEFLAMTGELSYLENLKPTTDDTPEQFKELKCPEHP